ncbi:MAG: ATP-grasp domain-containing protein [Bacteroidetes bacterium]|nr:ATP-grasp domain-containing protein [Bacteroidota bacterium]
MKVALVYNEAYSNLTDHYRKELPKELSFEPYFDLTESDPIADYENMANAIRKAGFECYIINLLDNINIFLEDLRKNKPDVVFNLVEIFNDSVKQEMSFAGLLELLNIPYTGAPPMALSTCQNKFLTKKILSAKGITTPASRLIDKQEKVYRHELTYPLIVKPAFEDASAGIENNSVVFNHKALKKRIEYVLSEYKEPVLIEEYIDGRELNVSVIGDTKPKVLPICEIDFSKMPKHLHNIVSYQAKWEPLHESYHKTIPQCPARLTKKVREQAEVIALKCFRASGCRDYARIDMRLSKDNKLYVLEVNPNPVLTEDVGFMRSAKNAGYSYGRSLKTIIELAVRRNNLK